MKNFLQLLLTGLILFGGQAYGQWCGADLSLLPAEIQQAAFDFYQHPRQPAARDGAIDSVALTIHIIESRSIGATELSIAQIESEIEAANRIYNSAGIEFFICGSPRIIQGGGTYTINTGNELNDFNYVPGTINIYFADDVATSGGISLCGYARFPFFSSEERRYIMMNKDCSTDGATLIHELGHFYGLYHTHETSFGEEYVDGSNCEVAGDLLCDTRADPNLSSPNFMAGCSYVGQVTDPKGAPYVPPVNNFMSYAPSPCVRFFTEQQLNVIESVHENENAYLVTQCDFYPDFAINSEITARSVRSDQKINANFILELVNLDKAYEANLRISLAQKEDEVGFLLHEERITLRPGENRLLRQFELDFPIVLGTGDYFLKAVIDSGNEVIEITEKNNTFIAPLTIDNSSLSDLVVFPNPAQDELKVFLRNERDRGDLYMRIYRYDGRLVWEKKGFKIQEEYFQLLDIGQLSSGFYIVQVNFLDRNSSYALKFYKR